MSLTRMQTGFQDIVPLSNSNRHFLPASAVSAYGQERLFGETVCKVMCLTGRSQSRLEYLASVSRRLGWESTRFTSNLMKPPLSRLSDAKFRIPPTKVRLILGVSFQQIEELDSSE